MDSSYQKLFCKKLQLEMWKRMSGRKGEVEEEPGKLQRKRQRTLPRWLSSSQAHQPTPLQRATRPWTLTTNTSHAWPANSRNIATLTFHNKVLQAIKVKHNRSKCLTTSKEYKLEFEREKKGLWQGMKACGCVGYFALAAANKERGKMMTVQTSYFVQTST